MWYGGKRDTVYIARQYTLYGEKMSKSDFLIKYKQVITELHNRWSDLDSEIVKRINSFAEKSPEILKPKLESW